MSDDPTNDDVELDDKPADTAGKPDLQGEVEKWKALARKHEKTAREHGAAAKELADLKDASKSELQRATEKATEAERRAADAETRALRFEVAADKGLKPAHVKYLTGANREELESAADEVLTDFNYPTVDGGDKPPRPGGRPREHLRGGSEPDEEPEETDPRKLAALIPRHP